MPERNIVRVGIFLGAVTAAEIPRLPPGLGFQGRLSRALFRRQALPQSLDQEPLQKIGDGETYFTGDGELPVENLLPGAEVELPAGYGHHHLPAHHGTLQVDVAVVFAGVVVLVPAQGLVGGEFFEPPLIRRSNPRATDSK